MSIKLLYVSSYHATLEYNHLSLFSELGIEYFSTGIFKDVENPLKAMLWQGSSLEQETNQEWLQKFNTLNPSHSVYSRINLTKEFVDNFDVVLCCFSFPVQTVLDEIWESCKHKPFIYLTYAQQFGPFEAKLAQYRSQGLKLVRGSERESTLPNYAGHDAIIHCHVDEDIYKDWRGGEDKVLSFANDFPARLNHPNFDCYRAYRQIQPHVPFTLHGVQSEMAGGKGFVSWEQQQELYRTHNVYFAIPSPPSTQTYNFLEAWMTGCPVVTFGEKLGNGVGYSTWEPPYLIENGVDGFFSDDLNELISACHDIIDDKDLQEQFSEEGRKKCLKYFGKKVVEKQWREFFKELGIVL